MRQSTVATVQFIIATVSLSLCYGQGIPECIALASRTGKIECHNVDLSLVTAQDINLTMRISSVELRNCTTPPYLPFLNSNALSNLKSLILDNITYAHTMNISTFSSFISSLEELSLLNMPSLVSIDFIKDIDPLRLTWAKMTRLRVNGCGITHVDHTVWRELSTLEYLSLRDNRLRALDFRNNKRSLLEIDLSDNDITALHSFKWNSFSILERFYMFSNQLSDPDILNKISDTAKIIDLSHNILTTLVLNTTRLSELESLTLSYNRLTNRLPNFADSGRGKIKYLNLAGNKNLQISPPPFAGLTYLEELDLHSCRLSEISSEFQNLMSLKSLNLSDNILESLPFDSFKGTEELRYLYLHRNRLSSVDFLSSPHAPILMQLSAIDLGGNELRTLPNFKSVYNLRLLSVRDNRLDRLNSCDHMDSLTRLTQLCTTIQPHGTVNCKLDSYVQILQENSASKHLIHNGPCCADFTYTNPACCLQTQPISTCISVKPFNYSSKCESIERLCNPPPSTTSHTTVSEPTVTPSQRKGFAELYSSEIAAVVIGYLLTTILLIVVVWFILRQNQVYKIWQNRHLSEDMLSRRNTEDGVDYLEMAETVSRSPHPSPMFRKASRRLDSVGSLGSCSSGSGNYSEHSLIDIKVSPLQLAGRKRSEYSKSPKVIQAAANNYTGARAELAVPTSHGADSLTSSGKGGRHSPTSLSVYSYASFQSERVPHQPDIDAIPWATSAKARSNSTSHLFSAATSRGVGDPLPVQPLRFLNKTKSLRSKSAMGRVKKNRRSAGVQSSLAVRRQYLRSHRSPLALQKKLP